MMQAYIACAVELMLAGICAYKQGDSRDMHVLLCVESGRIQGLLDGAATTAGLC
jgi:hypothetical protein